jgi:U3 small nucleolar ribonucleoprotein protein LCP5
MMAVETSPSVLLDALTQSLSSALEAAPDKSSVVPPKAGISLLDVKNDLLLSYLQNLVFLILLKLRQRNVEPELPEGNGLDDAVVKKLVELRVYLEKGVRPLEGRLKYQIDKVLRAADDLARTSASAAIRTASKVKPVVRVDTEDQTEDSDDSEAGSVNGVTLKASQIDDLQYRPQPSSMIRPADALADKSTSSGRDGVYRPPRITATAMPTTRSQEKDSRKPKKSATLDEFINTEFTSAPLAEPSIGSTIISGGRRSKSEREKRDDAERLEYEEKNYVRLPKESKKDRAKKGGRTDAGYGGEEWRGLGEGIDRIERLTKRKSGEGRSILEKSRKRITEDRPRVGGTVMEIGEGFQKRLKTLDGGRRDRGRR